MIIKSMKLNPVSNEKAKTSTSINPSPYSDISDLAPLEFNSINTTNTAIIFHFKKGFHYRREGEFFKAIKSYNLLLKVDGTSQEGLINVGVCHLKCNSSEEALSRFQESIAFHPSKPEGFVNKALAYYFTGEFNKAVRVLNEIPKPEPEMTQKLKSICILKSGKIGIALEPLFKKEPFVASNTITNSKRYYAVKTKIPKKIKLINSPIVRSKSRTTSYETKVKERKTRRKTKSPDMKQSGEPVYNGRSSNLIYKKYTLPQQEEHSDYFQRKIIEEKPAFTVNKETIQYFNKKVKDIHKSFNAEKETIKITDIQSQNLTVKELEFMIQEFSKDSELRSYEEIDKILKKLHFFQKYPRPVRISLMKVSKIASYPAGHYIFWQGDVGDDMYVILKGCVEVEKQMKEFGPEPIVITSLYDGTKFGELSLANTKSENVVAKKRNASCIVVESSVIISLPKLAYQQILMREHQQDIEKKVKFFMKLQFFKELESNLVIPLAVTLDSVTYDMNQPIIQKGEVPKGLYIIYKGHATACTQGFAVKKRYPSEFCNYRKRRPRPIPFYLGNLNAPPVKVNQIDPDNPLDRIRKRDINEASPTDIKKLKRSISDIEKLKTDVDRFLVKESIPFATLKEYDYFGGRVLLNDSTPAKFSIIVQSASAEVFIINSYHTGLLDDNVVRQMHTVLEKSYEVDCPPDIDSDSMDECFKSWQHIRADLVEDIWKQAHYERNKADYPFSRY